MEGLIYSDGTSVAYITVALMLPPPHLHKFEHRNHKFSPLCRLSEDLIIDILYRIHVMPPDDEIFESAKAMRLDTDRIMPIVSVCRRIRSIGLETPRLWATVSLGYDCTKNQQAWSYLCFERAKRHPLTVVMRMHSPAQQVSKVLRLRSRTCALYLETPEVFFKSWDESAYASLLLSHWPLLTKLMLAPRHTADRTFFEYNTPTYCLSTQLLLNIGRTITHLRLEALWNMNGTISLDCRRSIESPMLPCLKILAIQDCMFQSRSHWHLFALLRHTPRLQLLQLGLPFALIDDLGGTKSPQSAKLPHLRHVIIHGDPDPIARMLSVLPFPTKLLEVKAYSPYSVSGNSAAHIIRKCCEYLQGAAKHTAIYALHQLRNRHDPFDSYNVCVKSTSTSENCDRKLFLQITGGHDIRDLFEAITLADRIEFLWCSKEASELLLLGIANQCPNHVVSELYMTDWKTHWMHPGRNSALEACLRALKVKGFPLQSLELEIDTDLRDPEASVESRKITRKHLARDVRFIRRGFGYSIGRYVDLFN